MTMIKSAEQTTKQPVIYPPAIAGKIEKYRKRINKLLVLSFLGTTSILTSPFYLIGNSPKIAKTHKNAQTSLRKLQSTKKDLSDRTFLDLPVETPETKEFEEIFYRTSAETMPYLDEAIKSEREKISRIEILPEFEQYQENQNAKSRRCAGFGIGGFLGLFAGVVSASYLSNRKTKLEIEHLNSEGKNETET